MALFIVVVLLLNIESLCVLVYTSEEFDFKAIALFKVVLLLVNIESLCVLVYTSEEFDCKAIAF